MRVFDWLYGGINMTWKKVILFALIIGVYTGTINQIPALQGTSFQDIAVTVEAWLFFAIIIAWNTKKASEASVKIFVFFLISQPVVYLVELHSLGLSQALGYYKYWFIITLLTLPGGYLAYWAKKETIAGSLLLSCAVALLGFAGYTYFREFLLSVPNHLLTVLFCVFQILLYIFVLRKKALHRGIVAVVAIASIVVAAFLYQGDVVHVQTPLPDGEWTCVTSFSDENTVTMKEDGFVYTYRKGSFTDQTIEFQNEAGESITYKAYQREDGSVWVIPEEALE